MMTVGEALVHKRNMVLQLWLWKMLFLSAWSPTGHAKYSSLPEVVIPLKVTVTSRNNISPGWLSYSLHIGGHRHIITMKPKKNLISRNFLLFTYTPQGDLLEEQPFVPNDCYYHGYVDEDPESLAIVNTCFGSLQGILEINGTMYEIMPKSSTSTFEHLAYKMDSGESESFPMRCGLTEEEIAQQLKLQKSNDSTVIQVPYKDWWTHHRVIEYFAVVDHKRYVHRKNNTTTCIQDMLEIVNGIDSHYVQIDTDVVLTTLEVWNEKNHINVEQDIHNVLSDFCNWKQNNIDKHVRHDIIHLLARHDYGDYLGLAHVGSVCTTTNCAVNSFRSDWMLDMAFIVAHEMGHNLGMRHDEQGCTCGREECLMAARKSNYPKFSNCSYDDMLSIVSKRSCLYNVPDAKVKSNISECGNNLVEEGEQCDCGDLYSCFNNLCCGDNCVLRRGAQCSLGPCCEECEFLERGTLCREEINECDLPEWCNGTSAECPSDVYKEDGSPCSGGGYCYKRACHEREAHCKRIFGNEAKSANDICYLEMNKRGDRFGNCGNDSSNYRRCNVADVLCGRIQCENVKRLPRRKNHETVLYTHFNTVTCWTMDYHFGSTIEDRGAVQDGTACGPDHICIDRKCVNKLILFSNCSETQCNMRGVCNNKHNCHCEDKWQPPYCERPGFGGSIDSGPPTGGLSNRRRHREGTSFMGIIIPFVVLLFLLVFLIMKSITSSKQKPVENTVPEPVPEPNPKPRA